MFRFGPSRQERHAAAAAAVAPYGFQLGSPEMERLMMLRPFALFSTPSRCHATAYGRIDQAEVWAFEYAYDSVDSEGHHTSNDQLLVVAQHPGIVGGACFAPDDKEWGGIAAVLDAVFWVPPFTFVKAIQLLAERANPDRIVGHADFDRLYRVRAESDEAARRAIAPQLRDACVRMAFRGVVEMRPGLMLYTVRGCSFDGDGLVRALGYCAPLVGSAVGAAARVT